MNKFKLGWLEDKLNIDKLPGDPGGLGAMSWEVALEIVQKSIDSLRSAQLNGFDYPKMKPNGKRDKVGLDGFLLNQAPSGTTAPWLGFLLGNRRPSTQERITAICTEISETYGAPILLEAKKLLEATKKERIWEPSQELGYWIGVVDLLDWRKENKELLSGDCDVHGGNNVHLKGSKDLLVLVSDWSENGGFLRREFVGPGKQGWKDLCAWAKNERNINLDLSKRKKSWQKTNA